MSFIFMIASTPGTSDVTVCTQVCNCQVQLFSTGTPTPKSRADKN